MSKPKILYIIPRFTTGGAEKMVLEYAKNFACPETKFIGDVVVASILGGGEMKRDFEKLGITAMIGMAKLIKFAFGWRPDIVHTHVFSADVFGYFLKRLFSNIKWISTAHNVEGHRPKWKKVIWKYILRRADLVLAVSPAVWNFYTEVFFVPKEKIILLPNGIDLKPWLEIPLGKLFINSTLRLATIGRLEYQKGQDILLRGLALARDLNWSLAIFGSGSREAMLRALAHELGIADRIIWRGVEKDLPSAVAEIDIVIQTSRWEGMSLAVMEAMAAGRILMTSSVAGMRLIADGESGFILPKIDAESVAQTLRYIWKNKEAAVKMAEAGRSHAHDNFDFVQHIEFLPRVYAS